MDITLSITFCEEQEYAKRRIVLFRKVGWPSIPPEGSWLTFGLTEDQEDASISATIKRIAWSANGEVSVMADLQNLRDEYDDIVQYARNDGFKEYGDN